MTLPTIDVPGRDVVVAWLHPAGPDTEPPFALDGTPNPPMVVWAASRSGLYGPSGVTVRLYDVTDVERAFLVVAAVPHPAGEPPLLLASMPQPWRTLVGGNGGWHDAADVVVSAGAVAAVLLTGLFGFMHAT